MRSVAVARSSASGSSGEPATGSAPGPPPLAAWPVRRLVVRRWGQLPPRDVGARGHGELGYIVRAWVDALGDGRALVGERFQRRAGDGIRTRPAATRRLACAEISRASVGSAPTP